MRASAPNKSLRPRTLASVRQGNTNKMLYTIAVILIVLWLLGLVSSYTMGGFIHVLLVIAIVVILVQVIQGRRL
jgi:Family of unknown function (DUF5670)